MDCHRSALGLASAVPSLRSALTMFGGYDIKDMYVDAGGREMVLFLEVLDGMVKRGGEVRLIHAKDPGPNWWDAPGRTSSTIVEFDDVFRCDSITVDYSL